MALPQANTRSSTDMLLGRLLDEQRETSDLTKKSIEVAKDESKAQIYVGEAKQNKGRKKLIEKPIQALTQKSDFNIFGLNKKLQDQQKQDIAQHEELVKAQEVDVGQSSFKQVFEDFKESVAEAGTYFSKGYRKTISALTHDTETGQEQVRKGLNQLFDGLGALGPAVNMMRTLFTKLRGGFDVIAGSVRRLGGVVGSVFNFGKNIVKGTASTLFGIGSNPFAEDGKPETAQQEEANEEMQTSVAHGIDEWMNLTGNQTVLNHKELRQTIISALMDYNKLAGMGDTAQEMFRSKYAEDIGFLEDDVFDARKEQDEEEAEREKQQDKKKEKADKNYFKERLKKMRMFWLKQSIFASLMTVAKFLLPLGLLLGAIGMAWNAATEDGRGLAGVFTALKDTITRVANRLSQLFNFIATPFKKAGSFISNLFTKNKAPTNVAGAADDAADLSRVMGNQSPMAKVAGQGADDVAKLTMGAKALKVGSSLFKGMPLIGGILEGSIDVGLNTETYNDIKAAYEAGLPFMPTEDGVGRQMTEEEFAEVNRVYKNSLKGSAGRTTGGTTGAIIGGALGLLGGPLAPVTVPLGAILGGMFGSAQGESIAEGDGFMANGLFGFGLFGKGDQTKGELENFRLAELATQANETLENANNALADEKASGGSSPTSVTSAVSNTNNNTAVENSYHLGDDFTDPHLQYSSGVIHYNSMK